MTININNLELALSQKASAASTEYELLVYTKAIQLLKNQAIFVVSNQSSLPSAASNTGKLYFVEDIETVVWSNGTTWGTLLPPPPPEYQIWGWGVGSLGKLGDGTTIHKCSPVREISSSTNWCQVSNSVAIKSNNTLWSWGRNSFGALGDGTTIHKCSPVQEICSSTDWSQVSHYGLRAAAIKTNGQLWVWGLNSCGRLGDGTTVDKCSPVREFCSATNWCQVSTGSAHITAIKTSGEIWSWGCNATGGLGDGTTVEKCSPVREFCSATDWCQASGGPGTSHAVAIKTNGQLWVWGRNFLGSLGDGTTVDKCSPVRERCSATDWCFAHAGLNTKAIKTSGQLWAWGYNGYGRIGDGTTINKCSPVREFCSATNWCSLSLVHAIKTDGTIWGWGGTNSVGQLGDGTTVPKCSPVREISSATDWFQISSGSISAIKLTNV